MNQWEVEGRAVRVVMECEDGATVPEKAHEGDSGYDLFSNEETVVRAHDRTVVHTGVRVAMQKGYEAQVRSRSGNAAKLGLFVLNSPGTIDSGYRGEVCVILYNSSGHDVVVKRGDKIAQMVFQQVPEVNVVMGSVDDDTERGTGGFGSTGTIGGDR